MISPRIIRFEVAEQAKVFEVWQAWRCKTLALPRVLCQTIMHFGFGDSFGVRLIDDKEFL